MNRIKQRRRLEPPLATSILVMLACAGGDRPAATAAIVRDSAGIEIVLNTADDRPLSWSWISVLRLGGRETEPETFYQVNRRRVDLDGDGNVYVLDQPAARLTKFSPAGAPVWTVGGSGGGPGEFLLPVQVMALPAGGADVHDGRKRALVHFGLDGELLGQTAAPRGNYWRFAALGAGYLAHSLVTSDGGFLVHRLELAGAADTTLLAETPPAEARIVRYETCGPQAAGLSSRVYPIFTPVLPWHASRTHVAVNARAGYVIDVFDDRCHLVRSLRRQRPLRPATRIEAEAWATANPVTFSLGTVSGVVSCVIQASEIVDKHGYADSIPAIGEVALADDGSLWVRRWDVRADSGAIDVFDARGAYIGTLPPEFPFPLRFTPAGDLVTAQRNEMDVEWLEILRVERPDG
jgi:hypothetical protein